MLDRATTVPLEFPCQRVMPPCSFEADTYDARVLAATAKLFTRAKRAPRGPDSGIEESRLRS